MLVCVCLCVCVFVCVCLCVCMLTDSAFACKHRKQPDKISYISGPVEELQEALADMAREKRDLTLKLERVLRLVPATSAQRGW